MTWANDLTCLSSWRFTLPLSQKMPLSHNSLLKPLIRMFISVCTSLSIFTSILFQLSSVQPLSCIRLFVTPRTAACQASLSITNSRSPSKPVSIELVMQSNHLILCRPLLRLPSIFPRIRVFLNESALLMRWPNYWSFSFSISPSNEHPGLTSFRMDWLDLLAVQGTLLESSPTHSSKASILWAQLSL